MQTELQVSLDSESHLHPENISFQDGDPVLTLSTIDDVLPKKPGMLLFIYSLIVIGDLENVVHWEVENLTCYCCINARYSKKTNTAMGCLDTSRGGKFLYCITTSRQGMLLSVGTLVFDLITLWYSLTTLLIPCRILRRSPAVSKVKTKIRYLPLDFLLILI